MSLLHSHLDLPAIRSWTALDVGMFACHIVMVEEAQTYIQIIAVLSCYHLELCMIQNPRIHLVYMSASLTTDEQY